MVASAPVYAATYAARVSLPALLLRAHAGLAPGDPAAQKRLRDMRKARAYDICAIREEGSTETALKNMRLSRW